MTKTCLSCNATADFRQLNTSTGRCQPLQSYFESLVTVADSCLPSCFACTSLTNCSACVSGYFMRSDRLCYSYCLSGMFGNNSTSTCDPCPAGCLTCESPTFCTSCDPGLFIRADNLCYSTCLPRFYGNSQTTRCEPCPYDCWTCNSTGGCLTCNSSADHR